VAHKSKPLQNDQKFVLDRMNEIRFIRQLKVKIKNYNIILRD